MPELPEVETVRKILEKEIKGKTLLDVDVIEPYSIIQENMRCESKDQAESSFFGLIGQALISIVRKGKYLFFRFENDGFIIVHLKMTGQLIVEATELHHKELKHERVRLYFDGVVLRFNDMRKFGYLKVTDKTQVEKVKSMLGPDALNEVDEDVLKSILHRSRRPIKALLLDQNKISGIGNAYADEILFRSGIHPLRPANTVRGSELHRLNKAMKTVLKEGIEAGGLSLRNYVDAYGFKGDMQNRLLVYRREKQPCLRCGREIRRIRSFGRSSYFCQGCQK